MCISKLVVVTRRIATRLSLDVDELESFLSVLQATSIYELQAMPGHIETVLREYIDLVSLVMENDQRPHCGQSDGGG